MPVIWFQLMHGAGIPQLLGRPLMLLLALFFLLGLASSGTAYSPRQAFLEWANLLLLCGAAWMVATEISAKGDLLPDKVLLFCGLACAAYLLLEIAIYMSVLKAGVQPKPSQLIVGFDNYRFFNYVQTIALPMLGLLAARLPERGSRLFWWGITALWWMLLYVSAGRGTFVGLTVAIAVVWCALGKSAWAWCRAMLLAALAGLLAYLFFYVLIPVARGLAPFGLLLNTVERSVENPTSSRLQLWIALYVGCAWGWACSRSPPLPIIHLRPTRVDSVLVAVGAFLLMYALVNGIWPELLEMNVRNSSYSETKVLFPRIFSNGNF